MYSGLTRGSHTHEKWCSRHNHTRDAHFTGTPSVHPPTQVLTPDRNHSGRTHPHVLTCHAQTRYSHAAHEVGDGLGDGVVARARVALAALVKQLDELGGKPAAQSVQLPDPAVLIFLRHDLQHETQVKDRFVQ